MTQDLQNPGDERLTAFLRAHAPEAAPPPAALEERLLAAIAQPSPRPSRISAARFRWLWLGPIGLAVAAAATLVLSLHQPRVQPSAQDEELATFIVTNWQAVLAEDGTEGDAASVSALLTAMP